MTPCVHPLVIVGCGPAGLAAANAYAEFSSDFLVLEAGASVRGRQRDGARDIISGVGGAGLYSDGKFSFYPSATALWQLSDEDLLRRSYAWVSEILGRHGMIAPAYPEDARPQGPGESGFKPYPSTYLDLAARFSLIEALYAPIRDRVRLQTRLDQIAWDGERWELTVSTPDGTETLYASRLIGAGGRFFPLLLQKHGFIPQTFMRLELGVRIEGSADHPFFEQLVLYGQSIDPKLILTSADGRLQWRTFCCCVRGEVVQTRDYGLTSFSGRSDCPPTSSSNIGFNVRFRSSEAAAGVCLEPLAAHGPFCAPLLEALRSPQILEPALGPTAAAALHDGLLQLRDRFGVLEGIGSDGLRVVGPTVEGVGAYPTTDADMCSPSLPVHFAGDAGGKFRGIIAALVSGAYAGRLAALTSAGRLRLPCRS